MGAITLDGNTIVAAISAFWIAVTSVIVYLYKANERQVAQHVAHIERTCSQSITDITNDRNFWRDAWIGQRQQTTQRDRLLESIRDAPALSPPSFSPNPLNPLPPSFPPSSAS